MDTVEREIHLLSQITRSAKIREGNETKTQRGWKKKQHKYTRFTGNTEHTSNKNKNKNIAASHTQYSQALKQQKKWNV